MVPRTCRMSFASQCADGNGYFNCTCAAAPLACIDQLRRTALDPINPL